MIRSVRHVGIVVKDIDAVLPFYTGLLDFRLARQTEEPASLIDPLLDLKNSRLRTTKLAARDGQTLIELLEFRSHTGPPEGRSEIYTPGITHVALTVKDLEEVYRKLSGQGVPFISPPIKSPDGLARVAFCRDPEGNFLELVEEL